MRYVTAEFQKEDRTMAYRIFVTDMLNIIASANVQEHKIPRFGDLINKSPAKEETRSPEEIIGGIKKKLEALGGDN